MTPQQKIIRRLDKKARDLENENYHTEAGILFDLADEVRKGRFAAHHDMGELVQKEYLDGEKVLYYIADRSWI